MVKPAQALRRNRGEREATLPPLSYSIHPAPDAPPAGGGAERGSGGDDASIWLATEPSPPTIGDAGGAVVDGPAEAVELAMQHQVAGPDYYADVVSVFEHAAEVAGQR